MNSAGRKVAAVVVTFNRKALLSECLRALEAQDRKPDLVFVVDNASTDGTSELLEADRFPKLRNFEAIRLGRNVGGTGGFSTGISAAVAQGADWIWLMDDDAKPWPEALGELLAIADDPTCLYGSVAVNGARTSWTTTLTGPPSRRTDDAAGVPPKARVESLPFLGFLVHRSLVTRIGLPDTGFFIAADDIEYCLRARRAGADIFIAGLSRIEHPRTERRVVHLLGREITYLDLPPWKRYYDTRNRLLIARQYYGWRLLSQALPGTLMRICIAVAGGKQGRGAQLIAGLAGTVDGLLGIKGPRHRWWRISQ